MAKNTKIRYVSQNKNGMWKVSVTKTSVAEKVYPTQKEAILYAETINGVESVFVKRSSGWEKAYTFNKETQKLAKEEVEKLRNIETDEKAKNDVVEEITHGSLELHTEKEDVESVVAHTPTIITGIITTTHVEEVKPKSNKFSKFVFIFAIISFVISVALGVLALLQTTPSADGSVEFPVWSIVSIPTNISAIDHFANVATYGTISGLAAGLLGFIIASIQLRKIHNGNNISKALTLFVLFLSLAALAVTAAGYGTSIIVTDPSYLASFGKVIQIK